MAERLIDAEALTTDFCKRKCRVACERGDFCEDVYYIAAAPTIDAVRVVRCGKCAIWGNCRIRKMWTLPDDFYCAWGKPIERIV